MPTTRSISPKRDAGPVPTMFQNSAPNLRVGRSRSPVPKSSTTTTTTTITSTSASSTPRMQSFEIKSEGEVAALSAKYGMTLQLTAQQKECLRRGGTMTLSIPVPATTTSTTTTNTHRPTPTTSTMVKPRGRGTSPVPKSLASPSGVPSMFAHSVDPSKAGRSLSPVPNRKPTTTYTVPRNRSLSPKKSAKAEVPTMFKAAINPTSGRAKSPIADPLAAQKARERIAAAKKKSAMPTMFAPKPKLETKAPVRLQKWKDQAHKRRSSIMTNNPFQQQNPNNNTTTTATTRYYEPPPPVERVPKLSAIIAMGGPEAEEHRRKVALEKLAAWKDSPGDKWEITQQTWDGVSTSELIKDEIVTDITIDDAIQTFHENPEKYVAMHFQPGQKEDKLKFTYVLRDGTVGFRPQGVRDDDEGAFVLCRHLYKRLEPLEDDVLPLLERDNYTDDMTFGGRKLHTATSKPVMPGRGMGIGDEANMEFMGEFPQPSHVRQGSYVHDCWLLSAIACLADFHWVIERLFRKTVDPDIHQCPIDQPNSYTVTLWDLKTWEEVDITVDERLPVRPDGSGFLLGAKPSKCGKFWVPYLEKAVAVHCGGYDKLNGGQCTDAWSMLTGSRNQFVITKDPKSKKYWCGAKYNPKTEKWSDLKNSPQDSNRTIWRVDWPLVGGGGDKQLELTENELFDRLIAWDEYNYLLGAATSGTSDRNTTDGIVDNHAYSIIDSRQDICGTGIDLLLIRNPWGEGGELKNGQFTRYGEGWNKYPMIKEELNPSDEDDGLCWVTKSEFFNYFPTIYVCALNMARLKDSDYVNDLEDHFPRGVSSKKEAQPANNADKLNPMNIDWSSDPSSPCKIVVTQFNGGVSYDKMNKKLVKGKSIAEGVAEFKANPGTYLAIHYQHNMVAEGWPIDKHVYTLVYREGTSDIEALGVVAQNGKKIMLTHVPR